MEMLNIPPAKPQAPPPANAQGSANKEANPAFKEALNKADHQHGKGQQEEPAKVADQAGEATLEEQDNIPGNIPRGTEPLLTALQAESSETSEPVEEKTTADAPFALDETATSVVTAEPPLVQPQVAGVTEPSAKDPGEGDATIGSQKSASYAQHGTQSPAASDMAASDVAEDLAIAEPAADMAAPEKNAVALEKSQAAPGNAPAVGLRQGNPIAESHRQSLPRPLAAATDMQQAVPQGLQDKSQQTAEGSQASGLMENSLGNLLQEPRPLRGELRGQSVAESSRNPAYSLANAETEAPVAATAQNGEGLDSFSFGQEAEALHNRTGDNTSANTTEAISFDAALKSGLQTAQAAKEGNQPLPPGTTEAGTVRLSSGEVLSENQIVNQILERVQVKGAGDQSQIVIRMHPEELGEVKLALTMEKDQLRAQLLTQNHQVQEVLEKHLPRLHEALGNQGVRLEDIQVSVDSNANPGREFFEQQRQSGSFRRQFDSPAGIIADEPVIAANMAAQNGPAQGLSLRV